MEIKLDDWMAEIGKYKQSPKLTILNEDHKKFLVLAREKGLSYRDISIAMKNLFGLHFSHGFLNEHYNKIINEGKNDQ